MNDDVLGTIRLYWPLLGMVAAVVAALVLRRRVKQADAEFPTFELELGFIKLPIRVRRQVLVYLFCALSVIFLLIKALTRDYSSFFPTKLHMNVYYDYDGIKGTITELHVSEGELGIVRDWQHLRSIYYSTLDKELAAAQPDVPNFFDVGDDAVRSTGDTTFVVRKVSGWQRYYIEAAEGELAHSMDWPDRPPIKVLTAFRKLDSNADHLKPSFTELVVDRSFIMRPRFRQYLSAQKLAEGKPFKVLVHGVTRVSLFPSPDFSNTLYLADVPKVGLIPIAYAVYSPTDSRPSE